MIEVMLVSVLVSAVCVSVALIYRPKPSVSDSQFSAMMARISVLEAEQRNNHSEISQLRTYLIILLSDPTNEAIRAAIRKMVLKEEGGNAIADLVSSNDIAGAIEALVISAKDESQRTQATVIKSRHARLVAERARGAITQDDYSIAMNKLASDILAS